MHSNTTLPSPARVETWWVTGASSGIGAAIALQLAEAGHQVLAWGRDAERLAALQARHPGIQAIHTQDLTLIDSLAEAAQQCIAQWPGLSGVVHCAGLQHECLLEDAGYGAAEISAELALNLAAPIELSRALLPHLRAQPRACLVLVSSALAHAPKRRSAVYNASKAGLHAFAQSLRAQLQGTSVEVLELIPPLVDTPMTTGRGQRKLPPEAVAQALLRVLARRTAGRRLPERCWVGPARALPLLLRLAPNTLKRFFLR